MKHSAETSIRNSLMFLDLALKNDDLSSHAVELLDQANAIMQAALDHLEPEDATQAAKDLYYSRPVPAEMDYRLSSAINELEICQRLSTGILKSSVFNAAAALEKIRGDL